MCVWQMTAAIGLVRPMNIVMTMGAVLLGGWMAGVRSLTWPIGCAACAAGLVVAGGNAYNDFVDRESDRINHPDRPLPRGALSPTTAWWVWMGTGLAAMALGTRLAHGCILYIEAALISLWVYNRWLQRIPLGGNVLVGACGGLAVLFGAAVGGNWMAALIPAGFALVIHVAREMIKDTEDLAGDRVSGVRTFPAVFGTHRTQVLVAVLLGLLAVGLAAPWFWAGYSTRYLALAGLFAGLPCLYTGWSFWRNADRVNARRLSRILKLVMITGMIALATP